MPYVNGTWYPNQQAPWSEPEEYLPEMLTNSQLLTETLQQLFLTTHYCLVLNEVR